MTEIYKTKTEILLKNDASLCFKLDEISANGVRKIIKTPFADISSNFKHIFQKTRLNIVRHFVSPVNVS